MRRTLLIIAAIALAWAANAQTLNVKVGNVTYQFPSSQTGDMTFLDGDSLTIINKTFALGDIDGMYVDATEVTDNAVAIVYNGTSATIAVAGNIAQYLTVTQSGAHVSIAQSDDLAQEIIYTLSGTTSDGEFYMSGSYKATIELNGLTLTNATPVYSGAAVHIQNGKRINVKVITGTTNTLVDAASGSQKGCLYVKGHAEFKQYGTLNVVGNVKHGIKAGEYVSIKNATVNVTSAMGDGISCNEYFQMKSGTVTISGVGDDGIQCDLDGTTSTGETTDHEDEDSGNIYIEGGSLTVGVTATATKGIKAAGDLIISGSPELNVTTSGNGTYDSTDQDVKGCAALKSDGNMSIAGGTITLKSTGTGGKCIKADGTFTISDGTVRAQSTGSNYTYSRNYSASAKAIKSDGAMTISGGTITATASAHEAIETKSTLSVTGGTVYAQSSDDAINSASHMTISGGNVMAYSTGNDGLDANGNMYIKGGLVYAICSGQPEVALDANTEGGYKLYVQGGTIVAIGGLENGASLTQTCYQASSWNRSTWYAITVGSSTFAFKTPSSGGSGIVVSGASTPTLKSGVSVTDGTSCFNSMGYLNATVSSGSSVSLSSYSGGNSGGGPGGGGGGPGGRW